MRAPNLGQNGPDSNLPDSPRPRIMPITKLPAKKHAAKSAVKPAAKSAARAPVKRAVKPAAKAVRKVSGKPVANVFTMFSAQVVAKAAAMPAPKPVVKAVPKPAAVAVVPPVVQVVVPSLEDKRFCSSCQTRKPTQKGSYKTSRDGRHRRWICVDCLAKKISR